MESRSVCVAVIAGLRVRHDSHFMQLRGDLDWRSGFVLVMGLFTRYVTRLDLFASTFYKESDSFDDTNLQCLVPMLRSMPSSTIQ